MNIYVGNMPYSMTEADLNEIFGAHGTVTAARLVMDRDSNRPKGFGFVEMANNAEANAAIEAINDTDFGGRKLVVNEARPREERPARSGGFGGGGNSRSGGRRF